MPVKKKEVTPRKVTPPKFLVTNQTGQSIGQGHAAEASALKVGAGYFQARTDRYGYSTNSGYRAIGVYRLVKVLRPKDVPIEVEEIADCEDCK